MGPKVKHANTKTLYPWLGMGIDMSYKNPGLAVVWRESESKETWHCYGFLQMTRKHKHFSHPKLTLLPTIPKSYPCIARYAHIADQVVNVVQQWESKTGLRMQAAMEGYAFGAQDGHSSKLQELGGIIKYVCHVQCGLDIHILPPKRWKKYGTDLGGNAGKLATVQYMCTHGPCLDLLNILNQKVDANGEAPNPSQDIADACGILEAYQNLLLIGIDTGIKVKKKKSRVYAIPDPYADTTIPYADTTIPDANVKKTNTSTRKRRAKTSLHVSPQSSECSNDDSTDKSNDESNDEDSTDDSTESAQSDSDSTA